MHILKLILTSILNEPKSWIISILIATITYYIARFYYRVKQYPSGPFPLPFIGNVLSNIHTFLTFIHCIKHFLCWLFIYLFILILIYLFIYFIEFIGWKKHSFELLYEVSKQHKPIYTFWMGSLPSVIICDLELAKEAFLVKKNEIAGRPKPFAICNS